MTSQQARVRHCTTYLRDHESLDLASVGDMRTNTEVDHRTTAVHGGGGTIRNLGLNDVLLVLVVL